MGLEVFGVLLASLIQGVMITVYGSSVSCKESLFNSTFPEYNATIVFNSTTLLPLYNATNSLEEEPSYNKLVIKMENIQIQIQNIVFIGICRGRVI